MEWLLSLLGVLSLAATAYTMRLSPLHPDRKGKMALTPENERLARLRWALLPVNGGVCLLLTVAYFLGTGETYTIRPVLYLIPGGMLKVYSFHNRYDSLFFYFMLTIPAAMLAAILLARDTMLSVDLSTLKDLQYEYKGA